MRLIEKVFLSLICGAALAVPACYDSGDRGGPDDASDASEDPAADDVAEEAEEPPIFLYGPPVPTV
jgi:hypothetical protein